MSKSDDAQLIQEELNSGLGLFRAEYLGERIFDLFTPPAYWGRLRSRQPCFLVGGRGTGKTHALQSLSYRGQLELEGADAAAWSTVGFYWRIETATIASFKGDEIEQGEWTRLFGHFINLQFVRLVLEFIAWRREHLHTETELEAASLNRAAISLGVTGGDLDTFSSNVLDEIAAFELAINSPLSVGRDRPQTSILGKPIEYLLEAFRADPQLGHHYFTFCIDEYENLEDYQQKAINSLIKHVGDSNYTFKIGMRETGLRVRETLAEHERINEPADFVSINVIESIKEQGFSAFAEQVCNSRLGSLLSRLGSEQSIRALFPELSEEAEADLLGVDDQIAETRVALVDQGASIEELQAFDEMRVLSAYLVSYWAQSKEADEVEVLREAISRPAEWQVRVGNYGYASLFTIRRGRRGIRKHYAGWSTYVLMANGNIRYLLNLVTVALDLHVSAGAPLDEPVPPNRQSAAAMKVGERTVNQLQGLSIHGAQMTWLVLSLGRVFEVLAADPYGHTPEVAQFSVTASSIGKLKLLRPVLDSAVMHAALERFAGDKLAAISGETRDYDYQLHPIFAAFFGYSHRSKRRLTLAAQDLLEMASPESRGAIQRVLRKNNRRAEMDLPEQLELFSEFFK